MQIVELSNTVGPLQDFNLGLDGTLSKIATPQDHLTRFDIVGNVEVSDGTAAAFSGSTLDDRLGTNVKDLLCGDPRLLHSLHVGNFGAKLEWEFVRSSGRDLEGFGSGLEFEHGSVIVLSTVFVFNFHRVNTTNGSDPL